MPRSPEGVPRFLTTHQAAKLFGVSAASIVNWVSAGHLSAHRTPGGHRRICHSELLDFAVSRGFSVDDDVGAEPSVPAPARVLLVDDDVDFAELVAGYIEQKHAWTVEVVSSGFAAGVAVTRARPAVVVLDLLLPGFDGFAVATELGADPGLPAVPIVAMAGQSHILAQARARRVFAATLRKPIDLFELSAVLTAAVRAPTRERRTAGLA
jgi:two-component system OmpR family response regulator